MSTQVGASAQTIKPAWATDEALATRKTRGLWGDAFHRLQKNRLALAALFILAAIAVTVISANYIDAVQRSDPGFQHRGDVFQSPSSTYFFGTDNLGRDNWARVTEGVLISLQIGLGAVFFEVLIGISIGAAAALGGRLSDNVLMRFTDMMISFPDLLFIILLRAVLSERDWPIVGDERLLVMFAIAFVGWTTIARLVRGQMLSLAERDYVTAARALGATQTRVVFQHMLPNTLGPVIIAATFAIPLAIFAEAVLGFIGFGLAPPTASLGRLVAEGNTYVNTSVWIAVFPAGAIAILMLCFTFLGDGLRDALDPRTR
jgi:oligopeptide transport system permease protein